MCMQASSQVFKGVDRAVGHVLSAVNQLVRSSCWRDWLLHRHECALEDVLVLQPPTLRDTTVQHAGLDTSAFYTHCTSNCTQLSAEN